MVKLVAGTLQLQKLFQNVLPLKRQIECPIRFTSLGAQINFIFPSGENEIGILAKFSRRYFGEFESDDEWFIVHRELIEHLKKSFRDDHNVKFWTDSQDVRTYIRGTESGAYSTFRLRPVDERMKNQRFQPIIENTGLMPTLASKVLDFNVQARLTVEQLVENFQLDKKWETGLSWDGKTLELVSRRGFAIFKRKLDSILFLRRGKPIAVYFDWRNFQDLVKEFVGEVWLGIAKNVVLISQAEHEYRLTYLLSAGLVDDEL